MASRVGTSSSAPARRGSPRRSRPCCATPSAPRRSGAPAARWRRAITRSTTSRRCLRDEPRVPITESERMSGLKIVSVMTTASAGGAEFAAVEMLDALAARGHDVVLLCNLPGIERDTAVRVEPLQIGPKLSVRSWRRLVRTWPGYVWRLRRALDRQLPYDVLLVHYKKEQLMVPWLPRRLRSRVVWAEW